MDIVQIEKIKSAARVVISRRLSVMQVKSPTRDMILEVLPDALAYRCKKSDVPKNNITFHFALHLINLHWASINLLANYKPYQDADPVF